MVTPKLASTICEMKATQLMHCRGQENANQPGNTEQEKLSHWHS